MQYYTEYVYNENYAHHLAAVIDQFVNRLMSSQQNKHKSRKSTEADKVCTNKCRTRNNRKTQNTRLMQIKNKKRPANAKENAQQRCMFEL